MTFRHTQMQWDTDSSAGDWTDSAVDSATDEDQVPGVLVMVLTVRVENNLIDLCRLTSSQLFS